MRSIVLLFACLCGLTLARPTQALELAPFPVRNLTPLVQIFGLPPAAGGEVTPSGRTEAGVSAEVASHFTDHRGRRESIVLDGETYRFALRLAHGLREGVEIGAEIPYVVHRRGFLDSFIVDWHDFFGLPQGGRKDAANDRLLFSYAEDGRERLRLDGGGADGLGDIRLTGAWRLRQTEKGDLALRAGLKLPTGDSDRLLGSGSTDLAVWLSGEQGYRVGGHELALFGAAGALLLTDGDVLADRQRNLVGFGTLGGAWRPLSWLAFKLQVDGHTPFYDSDLTELGESLQLTLGGTLDWGRTSLDIGVGEDIVVDTAPDVTFLLALRHVF